MGQVNQYDWYEKQLQAARVAQDLINTQELNSILQWIGVGIVFGIAIAIGIIRTIG